MMLENGAEIPEAYFRQLANVKVGEGTALSNSIPALKQYGVSASYKPNLSIEELRAATSNNRSAIVNVNTVISGGVHAIVVDGIEDNLVLIRDPLPEGVGSAYKLPLETFQTAWTGKAIILTP